MLKILQLLFFCINLVYAKNGVCVEKHFLPINEDNFNILKRNITNLRTKNLNTNPSAVTLENNGHTVIMRYLYRKNVTVTITDGPYGNYLYQLKFMYFNWLNLNYTATGEFPIELHVVFFNQKYETYKEAIKNNFGLTVWSIRYAKDSYYQFMPSETSVCLKHIRKPNTKIKLLQKNLFLPSLSSLTRFEKLYYVYQGRLLSTLHPCSADVIWLEFAHKVKIINEDIRGFQTLLATDMEPMMSKYYKGSAPNGPIYQNVDLEKYYGPSLPDFEPFYETSIVGFAIKYNGDLLTILIFSFGLLISFYYTL